MMPAAKHFDPVLGIDLHFINPPSPVTPFPHPFVGMVLDPFDYLPVIGATVMVNGVPRAQAGTGGIALPPHIPIGGVFVKPPDNQCEMFMGSSTIAIDGDAATYMALPVLSCHDIGMLPPPRPKDKPSTRSMVLPTSMVLVVPTGPPVLLGGAPTISLMALGARALMNGLTRGLKSLRKLQKSSRRWERLSRRLQQKADDLLAGASDVTRNRVRRALCTVTGHPVDVATGKVFTRSLDVALPGPLPFEWERVWYSTSAHDGALGYGWHHGFDLALRVQGPVTAVRLAGGRILGFPTPPEGKGVIHDSEPYGLERTPEGFLLRERGELTWSFGDVLRDDGSQPPTALEDVFGNRIRLSYDAAGRLVSMVDSAGREIVLDLDFRDRITALRAPDPDEPGRLVTLAEYGYDRRGNLERAEMAEGSAFRYAYDTEHLLVSETDPKGTTFHFEYEGDGVDARCVRTWGEGGILERTLHYDPGAGVTTVTAGEMTWTYTHEDGVVVSVEPEPLRPSEFPRDPLALSWGRRDTTHAWLTEPPAWPAFEVTPRLDDRGLLVSFAGPDGEVQLRRNDRGELVERDEEGRGVICFRYDALGRRVWQMDPEGGETRWRYDLAGRLLEESRSDGVVHRFGWDARDNGVGHRGPGADVTEIRYAGLDWPTGLRLADGSSIALAYDGEGRLSRVEVESDESLRFERDPRGRVVEVHDTDGSVQRVRYGSGGGSEILLPDDRTLAVKKDDAGRVVEVRGSDGLWQSFEYDDAGRVVRAEDGGESLAYEYKEDRIVRASSSDGALELAWDEHGRLTKRVSPLGRSVMFEWTPGGRIAAMDLGGGRRIAWDRAPRERHIRFPNGVVSSVRYGGDGRRAEESLTSSAGDPLMRRSLDYDAAGNLLRVRSLDGRAWRFDYDLRGRVVLEVSPTGRERRFEWDSAGNLVSCSDEGPIELERGDRMVRMGSRVFRFDPAGRVVGRTLVEGVWEIFEYDTLDRMVGWEDGTGRRVEYAYDAMGRRRERRSGEERERFVPIGEALLAEIRPDVRSEGAAGAVEYAVLPDSLGCVALLREDEAFFLHQDARAVVREATDERGRIRWTARPGPLGQFTTEGDLALTMRLAGQVWDPETGLCYNQGRMFDPEAGRFMTRDPVRTLGRSNAYSYAPNVYGWVDPSGFAAEKPGPSNNFVVGLITTAVMGLAGGNLPDKYGDPIPDPTQMAAEQMRKNRELELELETDRLKRMLKKEKAEGDSLRQKLNRARREHDRQLAEFDAERHRILRDRDLKIMGVKRHHRRWVEKSDDIDRRQVAFLKKSERRLAELETKVAKNWLRQRAIAEEIHLLRNRPQTPSRFLKGC